MDSMSGAESQNGTHAERNEAHSSTSSVPPLPEAVLVNDPGEIKWVSAWRKILLLFITHLEITGHPCVQTIQTWFSRSNVGRPTFPHLREFQY